MFPEIVHKVSNIRDELLLFSNPKTLQYPKQNLIPLTPFHAFNSSGFLLILPSFLLNLIQHSTVLKRQSTISQQPIFIIADLSTISLINMMHYDPFLHNIIEEKH